MAHEDCKHDWDSVLTPKLPAPGNSQSDGVIKIREVSSKLKGKHANSTLDFDINCNGNGTKISFIRLDNRNKKIISYDGKFSANKEEIHGEYTRTDLANVDMRSRRRIKLTADSGDWDATKVTEFRKGKARAAKGSAQTTKKRSAAAKKSAKK